MRLNRGRVWEPDKSDLARAVLTLTLLSLKTHCGVAVEMAEVGEKQYALSCEILGHSADVRAVHCVQVHGEPREHVVTGSRDGTACVWRPDPSSKTQYLLQKVIRKHTGYVSALCIIPPDITVGRDQRKLPTAAANLVHKSLSFSN